jgi:glycosyltransferase involved in cell wall biosynthesis
LNTARVFNVRYGSEVERPACADDVDDAAPRQGAGTWNLTFVGRMDRLKGGRELLAALPLVIRQLGREISLTCAGDGPERAAWERLAHRVSANEPRLRVTFPGWIGRTAVDQLLAQSDLLVLPSLWPEPLALVGLEAARHRLPVAAFAVGGVSDWLTSGRNGFLAPGNPPTVRGLADAIAACLRDERTHARLREGAGRSSADFAFEAHVDLLLRAFADVAHPA